MTEELEQILDYFRQIRALLSAADQKLTEIEAGRCASNEPVDCESVDDDPPSIGLSQTDLEALAFSHLAGSAPLRNPYAPPMKHPTLGTL